ncbi:MAG: TPM domain-containing protein, partial [Methylococcales bacterium]
ALNVWDTEENSGVLIYIQLADKEVHIVADRGIAKQVAQPEWDAIAAAMQQAFQTGDFRTGSLTGIASITALLTMYYPAVFNNTDELPNRPVVLHH